MLPGRRGRRPSPGTLAPSSVKLTALLWRRIMRTSRTRLLGSLSTALQPLAFPLLPSMVSADFCTAAVLVAAGAVLGRLNPVQMLLLTLLGVTLFTLNEYILLGLLGVSH